MRVKSVGVKLFTRSIQPTGDPSGVIVEGSSSTSSSTTIVASPWPGWPDWPTPLWNGRVQQLTDTAWACVDLNASVLSTMPPYLVGAARTLDAAWLRNPDEDLYSSWEEFAKQLFWDYQLGEAFVIATARYATGKPARFHVVPPWAVEASIGPDGLRRYSIGQIDVTDDMLHLRYQSSVGDAHGHGPLEAGAARVVASEMLNRYATNLARAGGVPPGTLTHPEWLSPEQSAELQNQWVAARSAMMGLPAVLSGGIKWETSSLDPVKMALLELAQYEDSRIAILLGVPPFLVGLPAGGDSLTYSNVQSLFDYHWRAGLRPKAQAVMAGLSEWLLPDGTTVEVNRDAYIQPGPLERAQTYEIMHRIVDPQGNPALSVDEIRDAERLVDTTPMIETGVMG